MKLPRGTFHSIKKGILFRSLLDEIEKNRFTGYCTITSGIETCTLVLNSGIYIIADYGKLEGEHAWQKMQKMLDMKVDAGLTTLNPVQLELRGNLTHMQHSRALSGGALQGRSERG